MVIRPKKSDPDWASMKTRGRFASEVDMAGVDTEKWAGMFKAYSKRRTTDPTPRVIGSCEFLAKSINGPDWGTDTSP